MTLNARLFGLVLSGGKSTRMGTDKGLIAYHGIPQREYLYKMLREVCEETFMSVRAEQANLLPTEMKTIIDVNEFKGPFNGLLSAHRSYPNVAWLVLACDLPLMDVSSLRELIAHRDIKSQATAFALQDNPLPEPLCSIWEPHSLQKAITYLEKGNGSCPRKYLIHNDCKLVFPKNENVLLNANSIAEYEQALKVLAKSSSL